MIRIRAKLIDPWGTVIAEGDLTGDDVPGADESTPSTREIIANEFTTARVLMPSRNPAIPWVIETVLMK